MPISAILHFKISPKILPEHWPGFVVKGSSNGLRYRSYRIIRMIIHAASLDKSPPGFNCPHNSLIMHSTLKQSFWPSLLMGLTIAVFSVTASFAKAAISTDSVSYLQKFSSTLAILRVLQGITSTLTNVALNQILELIQWSLVSRNNGLRLLTFLSISPTTGVLGMLGMVLRKYPRACDRAWAVCR